MKRFLATAALAATSLAFVVPAALARTTLADHRPDITPVVAPWIHTSGTGFVDFEGSPVYLRGFDATGYAAAAADLGANFVRVPIYWSELEPTPPVGGRHLWDPVALASLDARVAAFAAKGINVLLDLHQSGWSS